MNFKVFNIPVRVDFTFWLIMLLLGAGIIRNDMKMAPLWIFIAFTGVLLHELGHALWARHYGARPEIRLEGLGGVTSYSGARRFTHKQNLIITFAGPATGLLLSGLFFILFIAFGQQAGYYGEKFLFYGFFVNLIWSLFNLAPILPLDGGHLMRTLIHIKKPTENKLPHTISLVFAAILAIFAFSINQTFIALFMAFFSWQNYTQMKRFK